jgi:hypothetical protein
MVIGGRQPCGLPIHAGSPAAGRSKIDVSGRVQIAHEHITRVEASVLVVAVTWSTVALLAAVVVALTRIVVGGLVPDRC